MTHRTAICVLFILPVWAFLACSPTQLDEPTAVLRDPPPRTGSTPATTAAPPRTGSTTATSAAPVPYFGEQSIEERVTWADTIVKARPRHVTKEVITEAVEGLSDSYSVQVKLNLTVSEYLNGSGASEITATLVWWKLFNTRKEAEAALPDIVASRDTTWDDLDAIFFLNDRDPDGIFASVGQGRNDHFLENWGYPDDYYSLHSRYRRVWLPSAGTTATGDSQEFLLAISGPTITLGELKRRIAAVNVELNAGDGSDAYKDCIAAKYQSERQERVRMSWPSSTRPTYEPIWGGTFPSGQPAGAEVYEYHHNGWAQPADKKSRFWLDGRDAALFAVRLGDLRPGPDYDRDGQSDGFEFDQSVVSARSIPAGTYEFNHHLIPWFSLACERTLTFAITANVLSPQGTLHEAFFDPLTDGSAIAADSTIGQLEPASFTDANGNPATIHRMSYDSGGVTMTISPVTALTGHRLDFIELDGSISLSLQTDDATLDPDNHTLSWPVPSQPWHHGDLLMLRIARGVP